MIVDLIKIYFRFGSFGLSSLRFYGKKYRKFSFLLPPIWWKSLMCKLGRHDYDLGYAGPTGSYVECMTCSWAVQSVFDKTANKIITKEFNAKDAKSGKAHKVKITETKSA
jgi:hypothetical protein